jgi:predicted deacetylase
MIMKRTLIVSLHDLHPGSLNLIQHQTEWLTSLGVTQYSILAVPHFHHIKKLAESEETVSWLNNQVTKKQDIVLHGLYHDRIDQKSGSFFYTKFYTANEAEFLDLADSEFLNRVQQGRSLWMEKKWPLHGFIAPAWLMPTQQDRILSELNFDYTTRLRGIHLLKKNQYVPTQSLCYSTRASWRLWVSLVWNKWLFKKLIHKPVLRLSLHPFDLTHTKIRYQIAKFLEITLANGYEALSYSSYAAL